MYSILEGYSGTLYPCLDDNGQYYYEDPCDHEESYVLIGPIHPNDVGFHFCEVPPGTCEPVPWLPS